MIKMYALTLAKKIAALHKPQTVQSVQQSIDDDHRTKESIQTNTDISNKTIISCTFFSKWALYYFLYRVNLIEIKERK